MIYNHGSAQRKYRLLLAVIIIVAITGAGLLIRRQVDESIISPLEQRTEINALFLGDFSDDLDQVNNVENYDPLSGLEGQAESQSALLYNGTVVWSNFTNQTHLRAVRQAVDTTIIDEVQSKSVNKDYVIVAPVVDSQGETYQLIEAYEKAQFREELNYFYSRLIIVSIFIFVIVWILYKVIIQSVTEPINYVTEAVNRLTENDYSYEYVPGRLQIIDDLGQSVDELKEKLRKNDLELDSSEQKLSLLLGHLNLGVVLINNSGKIELINHEAMQLLNVDKSVTHRSYQAVIKSFVLVDMINDALKTHRPLNNDIEMYVPTSKYIDVNIIPFGQTDDEIESVLLLLYDISQIRRLEKVRTEFVANASHELRTPVTAIKGFAETLLDGALDNPELAKKFIAIIANESNRLELIINDILELSRVEKQSEPMMIKNFEIVSVVKNLINFFYSRVSEKEICITVEAPLAIQMVTDQHRIEQIFTNLIDNAINYSDPNSEITVKIDKVDDYVHFSVSDTGIGIPKEDQERIFERFYRVDKGRSRNSGGTGLGLSIVRNLVRNMNGTIYVESELGKGSVFHVELPLSQKK